MRLSGQSSAASSGQRERAVGWKQWIWYTAWGLYQNDSGDWVGDLCFKGLPENGQPEIGYGLLPEYEHQGYATEGV